ncbi:MAG TPA: hypothetical protein VGW12_16410 [Pyrinomonadaceae bacterium]|nr:hypothetical protein [Pyrinomonadaceae bacterium]
MSPTDVISAAGAVLTGIGLIYAGRQVRLARKTARSQFLIQVYQLMEHHNEVHARLTGLGWTDGRDEPQTVDEWIKVGRVLGLFEYIQILVEDKFIDLDTVDKLYSYRLFHLVNNKAIRDRHLTGGKGWDGVIKLWKELQNRRMFKLLEQNYRTTNRTPAAVTASRTSEAGTRALEEGGEMNQV